MNTRFLTGFSLALAVSIITSAQVSNWRPANAAAPISYPCIIDGPSSADSQLALKVAKLAFQSRKAKVFDAGQEVRDKCKDLVVWPDGANDIVSDTTQFENSPSGGDSKLICVQKTPYEGTRFAVRQKYFNWAGDWFNILLLTTKDTPQEIFKKLDNIETGPEDLPKGYVTVTRDTWQRPWILKNQVTGKFLAIDTQHPAGLLEDWDVYEPTSEGKGKLTCKIRFRPPAKDAVSLLPKGPLAQIGMLLKKIVGRSNADEGTLHSTDRLLVEVEHMWGNVLYRPWAIAEPTGSRAAIDKSLKRWMRGSSTYRMQYAKLQALYPQALVALTQYYEEGLTKSHTEAQKMATKNLDLAYRSHFKF